MGCVKGVSAPRLFAGNSANFGERARLLGCTLLLACSLAMAETPPKLGGGVWSREGWTPPYLEADPSAAQVVISDRVLRLEPRVYLRGYTLQGVVWLDNDRHLAEVRSDAEGNHLDDAHRRVVIVDTRDGAVKETPRRGDTVCYREGKLITKIYTKSENKTRHYHGPLEGPVELITVNDATYRFTCQSPAQLDPAKLGKLGRPGWSFALAWPRPRPLQHGFGEMMLYEAESRAWNDPALADNPRAQAMAKQPFLSNMRVATGIYALSYVTPEGRSVDIPINPGEPVPGPQLRQYDQESTGYFAGEDAYFIPMFSGASNLAPFGLPAEFERLPHFARLLYRDGRVRLFTPPKVLWDDVVNRRATLAGLYSAAGIIWRQTTVPERKLVYYLQKGQ